MSSGNDLRAAVREARGEDNFHAVITRQEPGSAYKWRVDWYDGSMHVTYNIYDVLWWARWRARRVLKVLRLKDRKRRQFQRYSEEIR